MFLSDRDLKWVIDTGRLIIEPRPEKIDTTSIDLHLDSVDQAKIWNLAAIAENNKTHGLNPQEAGSASLTFARFRRNTSHRFPMKALKMSSNVATRW